MLFFGPFFMRVILNAFLLGASFLLFSKKGARPDYQTLFYTALGMGAATAFLTLTLFPKIGILVLIPNVAIGVYLLMKFCAATMIHAVVVLIGYELLRFIFPI